MICKNCGAQIDEIDLLCPYCGTENEKLAKKLHEKDLQLYKFKMEDLAYEPKRKLKKTTRYLLTGATALVGIFLVFLIISWMSSSYAAKHSLDKQENRLKKLEVYYEDGKYAKMYEYLEDIGEYGATYEKYYRIGLMNDQMGWRIEAVESQSEYAKEAVVEVTVDDVAVAMGYVIEELVEIKQWEAEAYIYNEQEGAEYLEKQFRDVLREEMLLKDDEIDYAVIQYEETGVCMDAAQLALARIREQ